MVKTDFNLSRFILYLFLVFLGIFLIMVVLELFSIIRFYFLFYFYLVFYSFSKEE